MSPKSEKSTWSLLSQIFAVGPVDHILESGEQVSHCVFRVEESLHLLQVMSHFDTHAESAQLKPGKH